ncbi:MAG: peptide chain release factor N(5)-glutamine methyltransferase [Sphingomonadaceae bacterium]|nr:peptide chain release factor N(5)-glutamine methyltransferase [Sphingomonadaceae bacterium]
MSVTVRSALRDATNRLAAVSETPRLDAELLMAHALGAGRSAMLLDQSELAVPDGFWKMLERRAGNEPVAYITGVQGFWDIELVVTPDVLIPRADSETLIDMAIEALAGRAGSLRILDLGTGSGALLLAAFSAFPEATGIGIDQSLSALAVARSNAERLECQERCVLLHRDWNCSGWAESLGKFDLVLCNPPYVEDKADLSPMVANYEPDSALFAGPEGLDDYRILIPQIPDLLAIGGCAIFEIGHTQAEAVSNLASRAGLSTEMRRDLAGNPRALRFSLGIGMARG